MAPFQTCVGKHPGLAHVDRNPETRLSPHRDQELQNCEGASRIVLLTFGILQWEAHQMLTRTANKTRKTEMRAKMAFKGVDA